MDEQALDDVAIPDKESESDNSVGAPAKYSLEPVDTCVRLKPPENIVAYLERRELVGKKGTGSEEPIECDSSLVEKVMSNYIIAKNILSHLNWRDKAICRHVCTTWRSAVNSLAQEQLNSEDFVYNLDHYPLYDLETSFKQSGNFNTEPLAVLTFVNTVALPVAINCREIVEPWCCDVACTDTSHSIIDMIHQYTCSPKNCMLTVAASLLAYSPVEGATNYYTLSNPMSLTPFYSGVFIPKIPNVKFHVLDIRQRNEDTMDLQADFYDKINSITETQIIKGALVFVTEKYVLQSVDDITLLHYLKEKQPDTPYALGGCLIEETMFDEKEIDTLIERINTKSDYVSENLISVALFTVMKEPDESGHRKKCNFEMYSLVITSSEWTKQKVQQSINEFANKVPRFEHTIALKLSCVGRDKKHLLEQDYFQDAFPLTPIYGCYGNGELGLNHPPRAPEAEPTYRSKRPRNTTDRQKLLYSYSTVFVYFGWGKIL